MNSSFQDPNVLFFFHLQKALVGYVHLFSLFPQAGEDWLSTHVSVSFFVAEYTRELSSAWAKSCRGDTLMLGALPKNSNVPEEPTEKKMQHMPEEGPYHVMVEMRVSTHDGTVQCIED